VPVSICDQGSREAVSFFVGHKLYYSKVDECLFGQIGAPDLFNDWLGSESTKYDWWVISG